MIVRFLQFWIILASILGADAAITGGRDHFAFGQSPQLPHRGICAHRGAARSCPENTIAAFREAARLGAHQIEFDVWRTQEGRLVVMHDDTLDRTTNGFGKVADHTLGQIKKLDAGGWKGSQFADERVPTLREALSVMPWNVWLNVHIKGGAAEGKAAAREIARQRRLHQAFLAASHDAADAARRVEPHILICNMERQDHLPDYVRETLAQKAPFIQFYRELGTSRQIKRLKESSVRINYCCTNKPERLKELFDSGVDFILVDDVARMVTEAKALGIDPVKPAYSVDRDSVVAPPVSPQTKASSAAGSGSEEQGSE